MKKTLILVLIILASCQGNVERVGENQAVAYKQPITIESTPTLIEPTSALVESRTEIQLGGTLESTNVIAYADESIYPFGDKRLRKHKDYDNSVLIEEPNKWNAELIRINQSVDYWMILDDTYQVSTGVIVGKLNGDLILYEINMIDEGVTEYEKANVMQKQMNKAKEIMKNLAYKLNKLN